MIILRRHDDEGIRLGDPVLKRRLAVGRVLTGILELKRIDQGDPQTAFAPKLGQGPVDHGFAEPSLPGAAVDDGDGHFLVHVFASSVADRLELMV
jgi:hypothetical protein